jgi:hypothetical protein
MFSVLVAGDPNAWETDQLMRMDVARFKEYSGTESATVFPDMPATLKLLEENPALLLYERGMEGPSAQIVRYGFLRDIKKVNNELVFRFIEEGVFARAVVEEFAVRLGLSQWEQGRTHWALKDAGIPAALLTKLQPTYDVVFSFAGEDRGYVVQVADTLRSAGISVFYDDYEEVALWGKDLVEHFDQVYRRSGRYCVLFISGDYVRSVWTRQERRSALARALQDRAEYILPARFDDTEVPGIPPTIKYVALCGKTPTAFAELIQQKLGRDKFGR